ncbi:neutral/alkaline non-lysosomal ceramidase N-terminal domain-containing protein [Nocardioides carbamazepini]|uniref:neutral/alkaline non-lysosomal ceramidase N-terminal domain-containing protein n=1 Tax=Nocardioides carbamazepini TaxID=2854259 RepID=UPI00214A52B0|nr:neutral/alkaline non-lysosomal ceramidase N-terminal domain-containing protein [Nocardioides carbamazepini]
MTADRRGWRAGRGLADVTGEPWGVGMMGYGMPDQRTRGILSRQYARAFVLDDGHRRVAFVVADIGMFFQTTVAAIHERLSARFGTRYGPDNVVLTATHTHCGPGGHGHDILYNITTGGFRPRTFERLVDGVVEAIARADADLAPTTLVLSRGELHDASANRARAAFERDPADERARFPGGIDPRMTLLRLERDGRLAGAISWFGVHNTSMSNRNRLISADNKGWAAHRWEQDGDLVTAFAQTNAGDLSPNLELRPTDGPTRDERDNTRIIGERQLAAARGLAAGPGVAVEPLVDVRHRWVRLAGRPAGSGRTGRAILGASFAAGKLTDGPGSPLFDEGRRNPVPERISRRLYRRRTALAAAHAPKDLFLPVGSLRWVQETYLLQLVRWGHLHLVCLPFEVTVVAGWRLRQAVATELGVDVEDVVLQGYANGYGHYVTTPEEYDEQLYEAGSTIFGRHQLAALQDAVVELATALRSGRAIDPGRPPRPRRVRWTLPLGSPRLTRRDRPGVRHAPSTARTGETVTATFGTDHPNAVLRPTYLRVERREEDRWLQVADDSSPSTTITWRRDRALRFVADVSWVAGPPGSYRITCVGSTDATTSPIVVH